MTIRRNSFTLAAKAIAITTCIFILIAATVALTSGTAENITENVDEELEQEVFLSVPYCNQGDTNWCLYYCLAMMYNYNNCSIEAWEIADYFNSNHNETFTGQYNLYDNSLEEHAQKTCASNLQKTIWGYNPGEFDSESFCDNIKRNINRGQPVLMAFQYENSRGIKEGHAILAVGYDEENIYLTDPSGAITAGLFHVTGKYIAVPVSWDDFNEQLVSRTSPKNMAFTIEVLDDEPERTLKGSIYITDNTNSKYSSLSFTNRSNLADIALLRFDGTCENGYSIVSKEDITSEREPSTYDIMSVCFTVSNPTTVQEDYKVTSDIINATTGEVMDNFNFSIEVSVDPLKTVSKGINYSNQLQYISAGNYTMVLTLHDEDGKTIDSVNLDLCFV